MSQPGGLWTHALCQQYSQGKGGYPRRVEGGGIHCGLRASHARPPAFVFPQGQQNRPSQGTGLHNGRYLSKTQVFFESLGKPKRVPCWASLCFLSRFPCPSLSKEVWVTEEANRQSAVCPALFLTEGSQWAAPAAVFTEGATKVEDSATSPVPTHFPRLHK